MSYAVDVLADSVSPDGVRLTTLKVTFPRFILAEVNTHRMLSRNSASSRAIPPEQQIQRVIDDPFVPETFNKRVKGMGVGEALGDYDAERARMTWLESAEQAIHAAETLVGLDCDKSRINRLLEPFLWHTAIISATEWSNFFALRDHPAAQPEFQIVARMMRDAMDLSTLEEIDYDEWHTPLVNKSERSVALAHGDHMWDELAWGSAGRCAKVSYDTQDNYETPSDSVDRARKLGSVGHVSPHEHPARPFTKQEWTEVMALQEEYRIGCDSLPGWGPFDQSYHDSLEFCGNFRGWVQLRKSIEHEEDFSKVLAEQNS
jgi:hypothetical protein